MRGKWLIEAPEMHATGNADNRQVKSFITRREERYTPKYGRMEVHEPRQCIFAGTTNETAYFTDETGERRYWPILAREIDLDWIKANRDQLWAEAVHLYGKDGKGVTWWPSAEFETEHIKPEQRERKVTRAWEVPIRKYLDGKITEIDGKETWPTGEPKEFQFEIWKYLSEDRFNPEGRRKTASDYTTRDYQEICKVLKDLGYKNDSRYDASVKKQVRKWWPPHS